MTPPHVLVADRNKEIVELVAYALDRAGLRVLTAHDDESALAQLEAHRPPVVVVDPVGLGVLGPLGDASAHTCVIVLSALDLEDARAAFDLSAVHYVSKPFGPGDLVACVRACLQSDQSDAADVAAD
jgi:two-component system, OmpR family, response regulator